MQYTNRSDNWHRGSTRAARYRLIAKRSHMVETSGYNDVFHRSYVANINDSQLINDFDYLVNDVGAGLTPVSLAGFASRVVAPSSIAGRGVSIDNGFRERRLVFLISVIIDDSISLHPKTVVLSGYTDISDISHGGHINPETRLYINSVMTLNNTGKNIRQVNSTQLITDGHSDRLGLSRNFGRSNLVTMRPQDVMVDIRLSHEDSYVLNSTNMVTPNRIISSHRTNNLPSRYVSNILTKAKVYSMAGGDDYGNLDMAAASLADERLDDGYLLRRLKVYDEFTSHGYIRWDDLCYEIDGLDEETIIARNVGASRTTPRPEDAESWNGADNSTLAATIINQSLASIMSAAMVTLLVCEITNETSDGLPSVRIFDMRCFDEEMDAVKHAEYLTVMMVDELAPLVSAGNSLDFTASITFDMMTNSYINISVDGGDFVEYVAPTFCDSLYSPVVTDDSNALSDISRTFGELINKVTPPSQL